MDLYRAIRELYEEKRLIDEVIASIEEYLSVDKPAKVKKRRGRKSMNPEERKEVSARMKKYWDERRQQKGNSLP